MSNANENKVLKHRQRVVFDPSNEEHRALLGGYLNKMAWGSRGCPFEYEDHWQDIPTQCVYKLARYELCR